MFRKVTKMFNDTFEENLNNETSFKESHSFEKRKNESEKILSKYPNRIPIIVERGSRNIEQISRKKYLVPNDLTMGQFIYVIRDRMKLEEHQSIYLFVNGSIPNTSMTLIEIYDRYKDEDNFLYVTYCAESTFG